MKRILLLMTLAILCMAAKPMAQKITLSVKDVPIEKVFASIEQQTGYTFYYKTDILKGVGKVTMECREKALGEVLKELFRGRGLKYDVLERNIVVSENDEKKVEEKYSPPYVKGRIVDSAGNPLIDINIQVKGTSIGTTTNGKGEWILSNVSDHAILVISAVNIETKEITIDAKKDIEITVKTRIGVLGTVDVIVSTGYQDIPKERATGSFVKIDNELLSRNMSSKIMDRIYDVTSSLVFATPSGESKDGLPPLQIRGASTINANKNPLIVVDNFPYQGDINSINPNDIESITILRDAAAASIWGVNSGNGVIVITTKKGKYNQRTSVTGLFNITIGNKPDLFYIPTIPSSDVIDFQLRQFGDSIFNKYDDSYPSAGYYPNLPMVIEIMLAARKGKIPQKEAESQIVSLRNHDVRNDITKYLLQKSILRQYAVNISGGTSSYKYFASIGYDDDRSNLVSFNNNRLSAKMNSTWQPLNSLEINADFNYSISNSKNGNNIYSILIPKGNGNAPYARLADENGVPLAIPMGYRAAYIDTARYPGLMDWHFRPLDELNDNISKSRAIDFRFFSSLKYTIIPGLSISMQYQNQKSISNTTSINSPTSYSVRSSVNQYMNVVNGQVVYPFPKGSKIIYSNSELNAWNLRIQSNFDKTWGNHQIIALIGSELNESYIDRSSSEIFGYNEELGTFPPIDLTTRFLIRPDGFTAPISGGRPQLYIKDNLLRNGSFYGNLGYSFLGKYLVNVSGRRDQSNLFGVRSNMRKVPLWSSGIGWLISNENFMGYS